MNRIEIDVITGTRQVIELTAEEAAQAQAQYQKWLAEEEAVKTAQPTKEEQIAKLQEQLAALQEQLK
jgi:polyhydroxyalkanoate synthesis regulator protein